MTTLREEIYNIIYNHGDENPYENTDKILKLFEQKIDEKIEKIHFLTPSSFDSIEDRDRTYYINSIKKSTLLELKQEIKEDKEGK